MKVFSLVFDHPRPEAVFVLSCLQICVVPGTRGTVKGVLHRVAIGGSPNLASPREERVFEFEVGEGRGKDGIPSSQDFPLHPVYLLAPNRVYVDLEIEEFDLPCLRFEVQVQDTSQFGQAVEDLLLERVLDPEELRP